MDLDTLLAARYGANSPLPVPALLGDRSAACSTLLSHRSIRTFSDAPLPEGTLELLVAAGQSAASSSNLQAWSVVAMENPERKSEAALLCGNQEFIKQAPLFLLFCADLARLKSVSDGVDLPGEGLNFLEMFLVAVIDASLAAQNVAVAAESMDLGICYVGAARNKPKELASLLDLPPRVVSLFGLAVGFPEENNSASVKPRLPQSAVLHRETYSLEAQAEPISRYDSAMTAFYAQQKMEVEGSWSEHSARRVASATALGGRDSLRQTLEEMGFLLK